MGTNYRWILTNAKFRGTYFGDLLRVVYLKTWVQSIICFEIWLFYLFMMFFLQKIAEIVPLRIWLCMNCSFWCLLFQFNFIILSYTSVFISWTKIRFGAHCLHSNRQTWVSFWIYQFTFNSKNSSKYAQSVVDLLWGDFWWIQPLLSLWIVGTLTLSLLMFSKWLVFQCLNHLSCSFDMKQKTKNWKRCFDTITYFVLFEKKLISIQSSRKVSQIHAKHFKIDYVATKHQWNQQQLYLDLFHHYHNN